MVVAAAQARLKAGKTWSSSEESPPHPKPGWQDPGAPGDPGGQTAGHHSGPQHLPASELFLNLSVSEDRHKESRLCLALQAHEPGAAARYWLGTHSTYGIVLSRAFLQPSRYFSDFLSLFFAIKDIPSDNRHSKLTWQNHSTRSLQWEPGRRR